MADGGQCQCKVDPASSTVSCAGADCLTDPTSCAASAADAVESAPAAAAAPAAKAAGPKMDWSKLGAGAAPSAAAPAAA